MSEAKPLKYRIMSFACDSDLRAFIADYAGALGISRSAAIRRLMILGSRCEMEHGRMPMPQSHQAIDLDNARSIPTLRADAAESDNAMRAMKKYIDNDDEDFWD